MARDSFLKAAAPLAMLTFVGILSLPSQSGEDAAAIATTETAPAEAGSTDWSAEGEFDDSVQYGGCDEVRAAGLAPLYAGDPGYGEHMDGDGDGVACEPYRGQY